MPSKKLTSLLSSFSKNELIQFGKYLNSPFFNENQLLIILFDQIRPFLKNTPKRQAFPEKAYFWNQLYPATPYNDAQLRRICSDLLKLSYGFMAHQALEKDPVQEQIYILSSLSELKLEKHFNGSARQATVLQQKSGLQNSSFHYKQFLLEQQQHTTIEQTKKKVNSFKNLESADYQLDCFYYTQKLKHYCDALSYKNFLSLEANIKLPGDLLETIESGNYLEEISVQVYYLVMKMLLNPDEESFFHELKTLLGTTTNEFPKSELYTLYVYLSNYCIDTKINKGRSEYFVELFEIFEVLLNKGILFSNGILDPQDYKNIITVGLYIQRFAWVEEFIQRYTQTLPKDNQENALNYNLAKVYFAQQEYAKVIEQLQEVEYRQLIYALGGKLMLLKTYFELKEFLVLDSLIDSFRIYLRRNKHISKEVKQQYLNVLRFVKKLATLAPNDKTGVEKIKKQVNDCKALADKRWILEKIAEVEAPIVAS